MIKIKIENFILITDSILKIGVVHNVFFRSKFNVQTSRSFLNYNVIVLLKSLPSRSIIVIKPALVLLPTLKNARRLEKAFNFDTVQSTWPPSWISKKVLRNISYITDHVQS